MADIKISALTELPHGSVTDNDVVAIVDDSATETKKLKIKELIEGLATGLGAGDGLSSDGTNLSVGDSDTINVAPDSVNVKQDSIEDNHLNAGTSNENQVLSINSSGGLFWANNANGGGIYFNYELEEKTSGTTAATPTSGKFTMNNSGVPVTITQIKTHKYALDIDTDDFMNNSTYIIIREIDTGEQNMYKVSDVSLSSSIYTLTVAFNGSFGDITAFNVGQQYSLAFEKRGSTGLEQVTEGGNTGLVKVGDDRNKKLNIGNYAVDESTSTISDKGASGSYSHAEGNSTLASGSYAHAEGRKTVASNTSAHAEGTETNATAYHSHAEGYRSTASGTYSHAEGFTTLASGDWGSHSEGRDTISSGGGGSHSEGNSTSALGSSSHAEGISTTASGDYSHAEGNGCISSGVASHAEGKDTTADGDYAHAEGGLTYASGNYSHAEGNGCLAEGNYSHAEGVESEAPSLASHSEGIGCTAAGDYSHAEGSYATASGESSHAEGYNTTASGYASHSQGFETIAQNDWQHSEGKFNAGTSATTIHETGIGADGDNRANAFEIHTTGEVTIKLFMRLEPTTVPSTPSKGMVYMDDASSKLRCYDGTQWNDLW